MDKRFIFGVCTGMAILGIITYYPSIAEALYSIPPTVAFDNVTIANNVDLIQTHQTFINSTSYRGDFPYIVSDGSILINITRYP